MFSPRVGTPPDGASRGAAVKSKAGHFGNGRGSEPERMPFSYLRDDTRRRVVVTMGGPFNTAVFQAVSELHSPDTWRYGMLFDLRGMTGEPSIDELRQIMSQSAARQPGTGARGPVAILAIDPVLYSRMCTYATLRRATLTIEVFCFLDQAEEWLSRQLNG
jgi:hypothetical protein